MIMTIDWNWFFAAFAQCGAALIGIIAAFIISKLLNESEKAENLDQQLARLVVNYKDIKLRIANRSFDWFNRKTIQRSSNIKGAIKNGDFDNLNITETLDMLYALEPRLYKSNLNLATLTKRITDIQTSAFGELLPVNIQNGLNEEMELIDALKIEALTHIDHFKLLKNELHNTKIKLKPINYSIIVLSIGFVFTVIYPLHFMPLSLNESPKIVWSMSVFFQHLSSLKGILLVFLTAVIEGIFIYFLILTYKLKQKYLNASERILDDHTKLEGYSSYFG
ncbi:hypothetical protein JMN32_15055 [Fulvivirga sp. 29W222]|uniref:Uncharacterized protein n=1 Tax=Fulvivirga marina TaxID=2494733 RepID=A0A937KEW8_9BACT|nr:hypothetical protein [Fulvivirga marina]MBL6447635.1 hypothetical protein [Fulvivirga marina]